MPEETAKPSDPKLIIDNTNSNQSTASPHNHGAPSTWNGITKQAKDFWRKIKEEDKQRKGNVVHMSRSEATAMTGYGEGGRNMGKNDGKGDKTTLAALVLG